ncbi:MAG: FMN-binding negative transcriptional regulator [Chthonomonadales bacterium]
MYVPKHFAVTDPEELRAFISANRFALLISDDDGTPFATHLPFLIDQDEHGDLRLSGHVARANPHANLLQNGGEHLVIIWGPHAYISPSWYQATPNVPTWNYATVHIYGEIQVVETPELIEILQATVITEESVIENKEPWQMDSLSADYIEKMARAIVGFRLKPTRIQGKWKMSQNRSVEDAKGAAEHLSAEQHPDQIETARIMQNLLDKRTK